MKMQGRQGKPKGKWEMMRKEFYERGRMSIKEVEDKRIVGQLVEKKITEKQTQVQKQEQRRA